MANTIRVKRSDTNAASTLTAVPFGELILTDVSTDGLKLYVGDKSETGNNAIQIADENHVTIVNNLDTNLQTFTVPASTTISTFGASLVDDADASAARTTLGVDAAGTDNSTDVSLNASVTDVFSLATQTLSSVDAGASDALVGWDNSEDKLTYLSNADVRSLIGTFGTTVDGLVPNPGVSPGTTFLRDDGTWTVPPGGGDCSSGATHADNRMVKYDGVNTKTIQQSGITIDDSDNVSGMGTLNGMTLASSGTVLTTTDFGSSAGDVAEGNHTHTSATITLASTDLTDTSALTYNADTDVSGNAWVLDEDNMASDSATKVPTQQSVKAYVDSVAATEMTYRGGYDASTNSPDLDTSPPTDGTNSIGDMFTVSVAGTFFSTPVEAGDVIIAEQNDPTLEAHWTIVNKGQGTFVPDSRTLTAGVGLSGGGDLTANRTFDLDFAELTNQNDGASTDIVAVELSGGAFRKMTLANFLDGGEF